MTNDRGAVADPAAPGSTPECPHWCTEVHAPGQGGVRVHRGAAQTAPIRAQRLSGADDDAVPIADSEFSAQLVRYGDDARVWLRVGTTTGPPLEIDTSDANRWLMLMGSVLVQA